MLFFCTVLYKINICLIRHISWTILNQPNRLHLLSVLQKEINVSKTFGLNLGFQAWKMTVLNSMIFPVLFLFCFFHKPWRLDCKLCTRTWSQHTYTGVQLQRSRSTKLKFKVSEVKLRLWGRVEERHLGSIKTDSTEQNGKNVFFNV